MITTFHTTSLCVIVGKIKGAVAPGEHFLNDGILAND
jgi:hypothetical protein